MVVASLKRPEPAELEAMLREPLGDPRLRLAFHAEDAVAEPGSGCIVTEIERDGRPAAAIVHDAHLAEEPELLQAAGAIALLAQENAELEAGWRYSLSELRESRNRIVAASEIERRRLERDLHDGAQQRLVALRIRLALAREQIEAGIGGQRQARRARSRSRRGDPGAARSGARDLPELARRSRAAGRAARGGAAGAAAGWS